MQVISPLMPWRQDPLLICMRHRVSMILIHFAPIDQEVLTSGVSFAGVWCFRNWTLIAVMTIALPPNLFDSHILELRGALA